MIIISRLIPDSYWYIILGDHSYIEKTLGERKFCWTIFKYLYKAHFTILWWNLKNRVANPWNKCSSTILTIFVSTDFEGVKLMLTKFVLHNTFCCFCHICSNVYDSFAPKSYRNLHKVSFVCNDDSKPREKCSIYLK